jgi:hypothetical protein
MGIDLLNMISDFQALDDRESETAWFKTRTPWRAPMAYFNIVFKPANWNTLMVLSKRWDFTDELVDFLRHQNGAILFGGAISFYGVVTPGQLLNRSDPYSQQPFDIDPENAYSSLDKDRLIVVGGYSADGSRLCIERSTSQAHVFERGAKTPMASWRSFEQCVASEMTRLKAMFDANGKRRPDVSLEKPGPPKRIVIN